MAHEVETMAYSGNVPWHGLGYKVDGVQDPLDMLKLAGLDWKVDKLPLEYVRELPDGSKKHVEVPENFALVRDSDGTTLSIVGNTYVPVQNETALSFFKKFTDAGHMEMETAGSLRGGRLIWALAKINHEFDVGKGDTVLNRLLFAQPHIIGQGLTMKYTSVRVVCNNTLTAALRGPGKGSFRMPHVREFDESVAKKAEEALGISMKMSQLFEEEAKFLASKKIKEDNVREFMLRVFDPDKAKANAAGKGDKVAEKRIVAKAMEAVECQPGADLETSKGTAWGMFNAVTYLVDHHLGRNQEGRVYNALFGNNASLKISAKNLALEYAKAA